jgi:hypothetical protein
LRRREVVYELLLPVSWLTLSLALAHHRLFLPALLASFVFFLTGLRQVHNAFHYALGAPRAAAEALMFIPSVLMLGSMHAVQFNHLRLRADSSGQGQEQVANLLLDACRVGQCARDFIPVSRPDRGRGSRPVVRARS